MWVWNDIFILTVSFLFINYFIQFLCQDFYIPFNSTLKSFEFKHLGLPYEGSRASFVWDFTGKFDRILGTESSTSDGLEEGQTRDVASDPGKRTSWRSKPLRKKTDHPLTDRYVFVYANIF